MTLEELILIAEKSDIDWQKQWDDEGNRLERFAALIRADEREACAKVCDTQAASTYWEGAYACAAAIRARSEK